LNRIGIFGGSFNPVHNAHIELAKIFYQQLKLTKVLFIPAYNSPFKIRDEYSEADEHRVEMLKIAISKFDYFDFDKYEIRNEGISYTIDTIEHLRKKFDAQTEFYLLIGSDQWIEFHRWKNWQQILKSANICIAGREIENNEINLQVVDYIKNNDLDVFYLNSPYYHISSQEIRYNIKNGLDFSGLVDVDVRNYIINHQLYLNQ
jgi:nicotinate-nucleotide adenylyltransferase